MYFYKKTVLLVEQWKIKENYYETVNLSFKLNDFALNLAKFQAQKVNRCGKLFSLSHILANKENLCLSVASKTSFNKNSHKTKEGEAFQVK